MVSTGDGVDPVWGMWGEWNGETEPLRGVPSNRWATRVVGCKYLYFVE